MQGRGRDREGAQTRCSQLYSPPHTHPFLAAEPKRVVAETTQSSGCETTPLHTRLPMILGSRPPQHSFMPQGSQAQPQTERPSLQEEGPKGGGMNRDPPGERCQAGGRAGSGRTVETAAGEPGHDWLDALWLSLSVHPRRLLSGRF